ncbi:unnamed protein product, partial [Amoebophrya sp. A25]|eukprot:GSA25T00015003001.1
MSAVPDTSAGAQTPADPGSQTSHGHQVATAVALDNQLYNTSTTVGNMGTSTALATPGGQLLV